MLLHCMTVLRVRADNVRIADTARSPGSRQIRYISVKVLWCIDARLRPAPLMEPFAVLVVDVV